MQKWFKILILPFLVLFLLAGTAMAVNITIYDGRGYNGTGTGFEIGETEPGMINSLDWDLQAFLYEGTTSTLSMGGGFNFTHGAPGASYYEIDRYSSGDIFLDITGDAKYGESATGLRNGYDIVIDVDWDGLTYDVYSIYNDNGLENVLGYNAPGSNPWRYNPLNGNGTQIDDASGEFKVLNNMFGYKYYATGFDLAFLGMDQEFIAHFTMGCGNDNLMGSTAPVPEPATMLLLGTGLIGLAGVTRRKIIKK